jgi:antagonist of KipI
MTIEILATGPAATIQDNGRFGYQRYGMPVSGPMDAFAFQAGNILVDNDINSAVIEFTAPGISFVTEKPRLIAVTGYGVRLFINGREFPAWMSVFVRKNREVHIEKTGEGMWGYLAVAGGFRAKRVMGSKSTYLRGGIGGMEGRALVAGDLLKVGKPDVDLTTAAGRTFLTETRPSYTASPTLRVVMGPQQDFFSPKGIETFLSQDYTISTQSDRMGYRCEGTSIESLTDQSFISDGIVNGAIQVPAGGQPIIMMADHQTTGGYPKIGVVISADLPLAAQTQPGGRVRFVSVNIDSAVIAYRARWQPLIDRNWSLHETFLGNMQA